MSSYVLILMLSAFLSPFSAFPTVGHSFIEALRYYGKGFNTTYLAIADGQRIMYKGGLVPTSELVVLDIFLPEINAAANVTMFECIRSMFSKAYDSLLVAGADGVNGKKQSLLEQLLGETSFM